MQRMIYVQADAKALRTLIPMIVLSAIAKRKETICVKANLLRVSYEVKVQVIYDAVTKLSFLPGWARLVMKINAFFMKKEKLVKISPKECDEMLGSL